MSLMDRGLIHSISWKENVLSKSNEIIPYVVIEFVFLSQPSNAYTVVLSVPTLLWLL